ncbi:hypothetical protein Lal_00016266 [Lupinus albus]|nr:hypothetical protein Lal_00016266 [Lupinus albus]
MSIVDKIRLEMNISGRKLESLILKRKTKKNLRGMIKKDLELNILSINMIYDRTFDIMSCCSK